MDEEEESLRSACRRFVQGHGPRTGAEMLAEIDSSVVTDRYGQGGVVTELETEVAALLGKEAALFFPTGTMAQQATLRVHAERRGRQTVVFHPACHLEWHEGRGYERLHLLSGRPAGDLHRLLGIDDLEAVHERPGTLLLELPQRDLGGALPSWDELEAQVWWARERGSAVHMDGARLWQAAPHYDRSPAELAALFDTVYVSFYKDLGAIAGCCVAGDSAVIAEVSEWRTRHGGRIFGLWPYAGSALSALRLRLPRMSAYRDHARAIADELGVLPGVEVRPQPVQTSMMHVVLPVTAEDLRRRALAIARDELTWTWPHAFASDGPARQRIELTVGDATLAIEPPEVRRLVERLVSDEVAAR